MGPWPFEIGDDDEDELFWDHGEKMENLGEIGCCNEQLVVEFLEKLEENLQEKPGADFGE